MSISRFTKSDRRVILSLLGVIVLLTILYSANHGSGTDPDFLTTPDSLTWNSGKDSSELRRAIREEKKRKRELRYLALRDSFERLKALRLQKKLEREARYQFLKDSFAQLKLERERKKAEREALWQQRMDSLQKLRPAKLTAGQTVDLNRADTLELMKIPGIGKGLATAILSYKERLGGYYRKEQVLEIAGIPASVLDYLNVSRPNLRKIAVNKSTVNQLRRHPYLNFYQAKAIWEYRQKYGNIRELKQLQLLEEFSASDFSRLQPYMDFR